MSRAPIQKGVKMMPSLGKRKSFESRWESVDGTELLMDDSALRHHVVYSVDISECTWRLYQDRDAYGSDGGGGMMDMSEDGDTSEVGAVRVESGSRQMYKGSWFPRSGSDFTKGRVTTLNRKEKY